jgi:8-oxo-dGTP pyrophosphatase MutT (NUDIX family)
MISLRNIYFKYLTRATRVVQTQLGLKILGPRAIILNTQNQILLVKHVYAPYWYLPGGATNKGESAKAALTRELKEEVGLTLNEEPRLFGIYHKVNKGVDDYPVIYIVKNFVLAEAHSPEIEQLGWFDYSDLPTMVSLGTKRRIIEYFTNSQPVEHW